jgi:hypothetical protein
MAFLIVTVVKTSNLTRRLLNNKFKGFGRKRSGLIKALSRHFFEGLKKPTITLTVRLSGDTTEIRTKLLPNTSPGHYRYADLLVVCTFEVLRVKC